MMQTLTPQNDATQRVRAQRNSTIVAATTRKRDAPAQRVDVAHRARKIPFTRAPQK